MFWNLNYSKKTQINSSDLIRELVTFYYKENESRDQPLFFFPFLPSSNPSLHTSNFSRFSQIFLPKFYLKHSYLTYFDFSLDSKDKFTRFSLNLFFSLSSSPCSTITLGISRDFFLFIIMFFPCFHLTPSYLLLFSHWPCHSFY